MFIILYSEQKKRKTFVLPKKKLVSKSFLFSNSDPRYDTTIYLRHLVPYLCTFPNWQESSARDKTSVHNNLDPLTTYLIFQQHILLRTLVHRPETPLTICPTVQYVPVRTVYVRIGVTASTRYSRIQTRTVYGLYWKRI